MKKISDFLVEKRYIVLSVMLVITVVCGILMMKVNINSDMTKYLPDASGMKTGLDIMENQFPVAEDSGDIRVMFDNLDNSQKEEIVKKLETIEYVDSVDYEADSKDYNNGNHTLYIVNFKYGYGTVEAASVEDNISSGFDGYDMVYHVDTDDTNLPTYIIVLALAILMIILFLMCASWIEPFLFLATIGFAIVINMGTNIFLGTVSQITFSIASILQLVLSMDYSIMLINRYRQEFAKNSNTKAAMKNALTYGFSSITSSSVTTIVGLLALCFMSFKIGMDLGIVLAKGVFISLICIFTILPALILLCDKAIRKTAKKHLEIKMDALGRFSYKFRFLAAGVFVIIFLGAFILSNNTKMAYVLSGEDPTEEFFPKNNKIVLLYGNSDETAASQLAGQYEDDSDVKEVQSFANTLGKKYNSGELADIITEMSDDADLNPSFLDIIYYDYYAGDKTLSITVSDFIDFIANDVMTNESFADKFDADIKENIDTMKKFADADNLTKQMNAEEIADFFGMDKDNILQLLMYYYMKNGGVDTGSMTLPQFATFIANKVVTNKEYASMFDVDTLSKIDKVKVFTNKTTVTTPLSSAKITSTLDMDESMVKMLLVYYYSTQENFNAGVMTLPQFVSFLTKDVASNEMFSSYFDSNTLAQMKTLAQYTDTDVIQKQMTSKELASALDMDVSMIDQILYMYFSSNGATDDWAITLPEFTNFLVNSVLTNESYASYFDQNTSAELISLNQLISIAASDEKLSSSKLAASTGMETALIDQLFQYASVTSGSEVTSMTLNDFLEFILNDVSKNQNFSAYFDEETLKSFTTTYTLTQAASSGKAFTSAELARYLLMDSSITDQILYMYNDAAGKTTDWKMSMQEFIDFLLSNVVTNKQYVSYFDTTTVDQLTFMQNIMNAAVSRNAYDYNKMAGYLSMDPGMVKMLYTYYIASYGDTSSWKISLQTMVNFIVNDLSRNSSFSSMFYNDTPKELTMLQKLINGTVAGTQYTSAKLSGLLGMDADQLNKLYLLYNSNQGYTSGWTQSVQKFVNFINSDILTNEEFSDSFDKDTAKELNTAKTIIDATVSGSTYRAKELVEMFSGISDELNENTMNLMYLYYFSTTKSNPAWKLSIKDTLNFLCSDVITDPRFEEFIDEDMRTNINDMEEKMNDGQAQLISPNYSRMILTTTIQDGSNEARAFMEKLTQKCDSMFNENYFIIGNTPMAYEMSQIFDSELDFITILTSIAIFIVLALTFRSVLIPLILVLIIQGGVYLTISIIGLQGYSIYYLALLIVECILMGATVDYAILFTSYFRQNRKTMDCQEALIAAYNGSIHTILTSGLIMVFVTGIVGYAFTNPTVGQICQTISKGALCAILLIVFILPGILSMFDKFINRKKNGSI